MKTYRPLLIPLFSLLIPALISGCNHLESSPTPTKAKQLILIYQHAIHGEVHEMDEPYLQSAQVCEDSIYHQGVMIDGTQVTDRNKLNQIFSDSFNQLMSQTAHTINKTNTPVNPEKMEQIAFTQVLKQPRHIFMIRRLDRKFKRCIKNNGYKQVATGVYNDATKAVEIIHRNPL